MSTEMPRGQGDADASARTASSSPPTGEAEPDRVTTAMKSASDPRVLGAVALENTAVSVWRRTQADSLRSWIARSVSAGFPDIRAVLRVSDVKASLDEAFEAAGLSDDPARDAFVRDIADLARRFSEIATTPRLRLRLEAVDHVVCPSFHIDSLRARLICTYFGRGTEFGAARPDGEPKRVIELSTGEVAVFRGLHWPGHETTGVVHRSPQTKPGEMRLVLVIDPDEAEPWH